MAELAAGELAARIGAARWFGGGSAAIVEVRVEDELELPGGSRLQVLAVMLEGGDSRRHLWVEGEQTVAAGIVEGLLGGGRRGRFRFEPGRRLSGLAPAGRRERPVGTDQSNSSRVVEEALVVKLYRRLWPGTHPEPELGRYLTEIARFDGVPAFAGTVTWDGCAVAFAQELVAEAQDGWSWGAAAIATDDIAGMAELGALSARLHTALAGLGAGPAPAARRHAWRSQALAQLDLAARLSGPESARLLRRHRPRIRRGLEGLVGAGDPVLTRVHGDYHVGQVLSSPAGLAVIDLEGEPTRSVVERSAPGCPVRDVAAMLRSFDHLARHVQHERGPGCERCESWIDRARAAFLAGYGPVDRELLRAFELEREVYEFVYAARFLPGWAYAPRGGLDWLMERAE